MSILSSKFDIVSVENPIAVAALGIVLPANSAVVGSPAFSINGTPAAGLVPPGAIVAMNASGEATLATTAADVVTTRLGKQVVFVAIDGNQDYSGAFTNKLTCLQGGFAMLTDQWTSASPAVEFAPGKFVSFTAGKIIAATSTNQWMGVCGPAGYDSAEGVVQVLVPQGSIG